MAWYKCIGNNSGGGQLTVEKIEESDWDILLNKDSNTLYLVTADSRPDLILYQYLGNTRLSMYRQDLSAYEFWYENMSIADYIIDTNVVIGGANYSRPWQIELNMGKRANLGESCFISFNENSGVEIYYSSGSLSDTNLKIYGGFFGRDGDILTSNFENADVIIKYENNAITVTTNGIQTYTTSTYRDMGTKKIRLFRRGTEEFKASGFINYIGFKWLD